MSIAKSGLLWDDLFGKKRAVGTVKVTISPLTTRLPHLASSGEDEWRKAWANL